MDINKVYNITHTNNTYSRTQKKNTKQNRQDLNHILGNINLKHESASRTKYYASS